MEIDGSQVLHILVAGTGKLRYIQRTNCSDINTNTDRERESDESREEMSLTPVLSFTIWQRGFGFS